MNLAVKIAMAVLGLLAVGTAVFLLKARQALERLMALDVLGLLFVSFLILIALQKKDPFYLDLALAFGGLGFIGTLAWTRFWSDP
jgi:multicomponent Na+:H+ antiporter subunit F